MYHPSLEQVKRMADNGNLVPVFREIHADLETPVSAFLKVARGPYSFLLESVEGGERLARYSFIGSEPYRVLKTGPGQPDGEKDPLVAIQEEMDRFHPVTVPGLPRFIGGAVGYLSYECVRYFEPRIKPGSQDDLDLPESVFLFTDTLLVFDHLKHTIKIVSHARLDGDIEQTYRQALERIDCLAERLATPLAVPHHSLPSQEIHTGHNKSQSNLTPEGFHNMVRQTREYIEAGDIIQCVLSQRIAQTTVASPFDIYRALRTVNPSPYMYYLRLHDFDIVGASPESLVRVEDGIVSTHPIAGTRPRGKNTDEDNALEEELRADEKERAEHIMLVDLGRNDIGRVSKPGTVKVTQLMDVERYSHVMHLVSHVIGDLQEDYTVADALRACFPAGTVSGAPKVRAMEIIREMELTQRGPYAGAVGYFSFSGNMDTAITIRTIVVKDNIAYVQAGAGLVFDSKPEREFQETIHKAQALLKAIEEAELRN